MYSTNATKLMDGRIRVSAKGTAPLPQSDVKDGRLLDDMRLLIKLRLDKLRPGNDNLKEHIEIFPELEMYPGEYGVELSVYLDNNATQTD